MTFLLLETANRHAVAAGYRHGFWGHPDRSGSRPRVIVIHTTESTWDLTGPDTGAENVGRFLAHQVDRPASYHQLVDSDSTQPLLPDSAVAFGARGANRDGLHVAVAGVAAGWRRLPAGYRDAVLDRLAAVIVTWCRLHGIPPVRLTAGEATDGRSRGLTGHVDHDPARRTDPGADFPWHLLLNRLNKERTVALTDDEIETVRQIHRALQSLDPPSNGWALAEIVKHLRNHPKAASGPPAPHTHDIVVRGTTTRENLT